MKRHTGRKTKAVRFGDILKLAKKAARRHKPRVAVAGADTPIVLDVLCDAAHRGFAEPLLFGDEARITEIASEQRLDLAGCDIINVKDPTAMARRASETARNGDADVLMKGNITTATIMKAALDEDIGIKTDRLMSHVAVFEVKGYDRVMFMSDGGIVIDPDLSQKGEIVKNGIQVAHALGVAKPKVALISSIEIVNTKMKSAVDAAIIAKMADRGQITGAVVDGPFGFDNAISPEAAAQKGVKSPVAGRADVLIVGQSIFCHRHFVRVG